MKNKLLLPILLVCLVAFIVRVLVLFMPMSPWWDPAIYVGMAKYFFSGGTIGMWEILRPPLWPIIIGITWVIGLNPLMAAQWLVTLSGIATIILVYSIGEKETKGTGLAAAIILASSSAYAFFAAIPTNDIPSALLAIGAAYTLLKKHHFLSGLIVALAFLMRFPHGLFLMPFGLFILIETWNTTQRMFARESFKKVIRLAAGFALLTIPYFLLNIKLYSDPLLPLKLGREVIEGNPDQSVLFYLYYGLIDNPLLILGIIGIIAFVVAVIQNRKLPSSPVTLSLLCVIVVGSYMSYVGHKELRYSFGYLPFLSIVAAYGLVVVWQTCRWRYAKVAALSVVTLIGVFYMSYQATRQYTVTLSPERLAYYQSVPKLSSTITSSPQVMLYSDTKITGVFYTWEGGITILKAQTFPFDYVAIDECQIECTTDCPKQKEKFTQSLPPRSIRMYEAKDGQCNLSVYTIR